MQSLQFDAPQIAFIATRMSHAGFDARVSMSCD